MEALLQHWDSVTSGRSGTVVAVGEWSIINDDRAVVSSLSVDNDSVPRLLHLTNGDHTVIAAFCFRLDYESRFVESSSAIVVETHKALAVHPTNVSVEDLVLNFEVQEICEAVCEVCDRIRCKCNPHQRTERLRAAAIAQLDQHVASLQTEPIVVEEVQEKPTEPAVEVEAPIHPESGANKKTESRSCCLVA